MGIIVFLLVLTLVVAIHEYGHYLACRLFKIPVEKFSVGVGKLLLSRTSKSGTEWGLRLWPIGGYVVPEKEAMAAASPGQKAVVAVMGPVFNLVPFGLLATAFGKGTVFWAFIGQMYLTGVIALFNVITLPVRWLFGIEAVGKAVKAAGGGTAASADLVGPIGIGSTSVDAANAMGFGMAFVVLFVAISLGLGLINLIPMPPLDGGRIVLAGVEKVMGRNRDGYAKVEKVATVVGALLMLVAFIIIMTSDVLRLF